MHAHAHAHAHSCFLREARALQNPGRCRPHVAPPWLLRRVRGLAVPRVWSQCHLPTRVADADPQAWQPVSDPRLRTCVCAGGPQTSPFHPEAWHQRPGTPFPPSSTLFETSLFPSLLNLSPAWYTGHPLCKNLIPVAFLLCFFPRPHPQTPPLGGCGGGGGGRGGFVLAAEHSLPGAHLLPRTT